MMIIYRFGNENWWGWKTQFRNSAQYNFGWCAVSAVNGMLWGTWVTRKNIYKTVIINILLLGSEVWYFNKYTSKNILAVEMYFWKHWTRWEGKGKLHE